MASAAWYAVYRSGKKSTFKKFISTGRCHYPDSGLYLRRNQMKRNKWKSNRYCRAPPCGRRQRAIRKAGYRHLKKCFNKEKTNDKQKETHSAHLHCLPRSYCRRCAFGGCIDENKKGEQSTAYRCNITTSITNGASHSMTVDVVTQEARTGIYKHENNPKRFL